MSQDKQSAIEAAAREMIRMNADPIIYGPHEYARGVVLAYLNALVQDEGAVEALARTICADEYGNPDGFEAITLEGVERQTPRWKYCNGSARAVLRTLATRAQGESL